MGLLRRDDTFVKFVFSDFMISSPNGMILCIMQWDVNSMAF